MGVVGNKLVTQYLLIAPIYMNTYIAQVRNTILLCEHPPVYTLGRRSLNKGIEEDQKWLQSLGAEVHKVRSETQAGRQQADRHY